MDVLISRCKNISLARKDSSAESKFDRFNAAILQFSIRIDDVGHAAPQRLHYIIIYRPCFVMSGGLVHFEKEKETI